MSDIAKKSGRAAAVAAAISTALGVVAVTAASPAFAAGDKCYGISEAGGNECAAGPGTSCAGTSTIDYQGNAWTTSYDGDCEDVTITGMDGKERMGSLEPVARDLPAGAPTDGLMEVEGFMPHVDS